MNRKRLSIPPYNPALRDLIRGKHECSNPLANEEVEHRFLGWHEGGYLPHRDEPGLIQFVTFRLADAFPKALRSEWEFLLKIENDFQKQIELESYLDKGRGDCFLKQQEIAKCVEDSLLFRHGQTYELRAWVIMPNHVHVLFKVLDVPMSQLLDAWKGFTAKQANKILKRRGKFWQDGYWDTFIRSKGNERLSRHYIESNPVKAGLIKSGTDWPWSSARFRDKYERLCLPT